MIVIEVESLVQAETRVKHRRSHHCPRSVSVLLKNGGERGLRRAQFVATEVMHPAQRGICAGKNYGVSRQRNRNWSVGALETHSFRSQCINVRSANLLVAVTSQMV